jgi:diguanylate cyclase
LSKRGWRQLMEPRRTSATWRGWAGTPRARDAVKSAPLAAGAPLGNRLFPKTRSWFTLGAPIELLSPISVFRILFGLQMIMWPIAGAPWRWPGLPVPLVFGAGSAMVATWVILLAVRSLRVAWCWALAALWEADTSLLVWSGHGGGLALAWVTLFVPMAITVAFFLEARSVGAYQLGAMLGTWLALWPSQGPGRAFVVALIVGVTVLAASLATLLLGRPARRQEAVDPDTGLPNGFGLAARMDPGLQSTGVVVASVVVDGIAAAREAMGYQVGTELLRRAVEDLGQVLPPDTVIGRVEGDELIILEPLPAEAAHGGAVTMEPDDPDGGPGQRPTAAIAAARSLAGTLVRSIGSGQYLIAGVEVSMRAHVGVAVAPWDGTVLPQLVRCASLTAHRAVAEGADMTLWDGDRGAMTPEDLAILADLRTAGDRGELSLAFQPQVSPSDGRTVSVEALLRWASPRHGVVSPGRFVPLAERTGLVDRLTEWVLAAALDAQVRWRQAGIDIGVSVNFSARTLARSDLSDWVLHELEIRGLPAGSLTVEMTETIAADLTRAVELLGPLRRAGVRVSVDDFGTGYTSLGAIPLLPLDELKIDRRFVQAAPSSPADEAIVRAVRELAHRLGLVTVAEGVEDDATKRLALDAGYDLLQGFLLARPMGEKELLDSLLAPSHVAGLTG